MWKYGCHLLSAISFSFSLLVKFLPQVKKKSRKSTLLQQGMSLDLGGFLKLAWVKKTNWKTARWSSFYPQVLQEWMRFMYQFIYIHVHSNPEWWGLSTLWLKHYRLVHIDLDTWISVSSVKCWLLNSNCLFWKLQNFAFHASFARK